MEKERITSAKWKVMRRRKQSSRCEKRSVSDRTGFPSDLIPGTSERGKDGMDRAEGSRAWRLLYCSVCGKAFGCKAGSEESRKEERTLAGDRQGAAEQSKRGIVPQVRNVMSFREAMNYAKELDVVLVPYELQEGMKATEAVISKIDRGSLSVSLSDRKAGLMRVRSIRRKRPERSQSHLESVF